MIRSAAVLICLVLLIPSWIGAAEGKWTPSQVLQLGAAHLKALGLEIEPRQLWDDATGEGLLAATVALPGCTAAFVSAQGLLVTNHHCAFSILQQHSTPERDLITHGFVASSRAAELSGRGFSATVPLRFEEVTATVLAAVPEAADDLTRFRALDRRAKELVGVNFDRVWENVANDLGYNPDVARNVSVDARYLLWTLETLGGAEAGWLLAELGVTAAESAQ